MDAWVLIWFDSGSGYRGWPRWAWRAARPGSRSRPSQVYRRCHHRGRRRPPLVCPPSAPDLRRAVPLAATCWHASPDWVRRSDTWERAWIPDSGAAAGAAAPRFRAAAHPQKIRRRPRPVRPPTAAPPPRSPPLHPPDSRPKVALTSPPRAVAAVTPERVDGLSDALLCSAMTRVEALHAGACRATAVRNPRVTAERRAMVFGGDGRFRRAERDGWADDSAVCGLAVGGTCIYRKWHTFDVLAQRSPQMTWTQIGGRTTVQKVPLHSASFRLPKPQLSGELPAGSLSRRRGWAGGCPRPSGPSNRPQIGPQPSSGVA